MKSIQHSKNPINYAWIIPIEYVRAIGITKGKEFSYTINPDGSLLITPTLQR